MYSVFNLGVAAWQRCSLYSFHAHVHIEKSHTVRYQSEIKRVYRWELLFKRAGTNVPEDDFQFGFVVAANGR